jgi:hypothetical protein
MAPSTVSAGVTSDSSRFVLKVNETLPARRRVCARLTSLRRQLLAKLALDRERRRGPAEQALTRAPE